MRIRFYENTNVIDKAKILNSISDDIAKTIVSQIKSLKIARYFFSQNSNSVWLTNKLFVKYITDSLLSTDRNRSILAANYLSKTTSSKTSQRIIYKIIKVVIVDDPNVKWILLDVISKLDAKYSVLLFPQIKNLISKGLHEHETIEIIVKRMITNERKNAALTIFEYLTKPEKEKYTKEIKKELKGTKLNNAKPILDNYEFKELINKLLPSMKEKYPLEVSEILKKNLIRCFDIESSNKKYKEDYSWIWRSAIEEHEQNHDFGKITEVLTSALRDVVEHIAKTDNKNILKRILNNYLISPYSIFRRLSFHILRLHFKNNERLIISVISQYKYFDDYKIKHEYSLLLRDHFNKLPVSVSYNYLKWIDAGPDVDRFIIYQKQQGISTTESSIKAYQDYWRYERLWIIRDHIPDRKEQIEEYRKQFNELKHPDLSSWHEETIGGYESPLSTNHVSSLSEIILIQLFKFPPNVPEEKHFQYLGFAKVFEETVKFYLLKDIGFIVDPLLMKNNEIAPIFIGHYFQGIAAAIKEKQIEWPDSLTQLALYAAGRKVETQDASRGKYSRVRFDLVSLIEDLLRNRERRLSKELLVSLRDILIAIEGEPDSSLDMELQKPNEDWSFVALNSTSGRVIHGLFQYSLRYAIEMKDIIGINKSKFDPEIIKVFEKILNTEMRPSVRSVFGMYLANLWYLDAAWAKKHISQLFLDQDIVVRNAVWVSYLQYNNLYKDIYDSLKDEYRKAVNDLDPNQENIRAGGKLVDHISLIYLRGWDQLDAKNSLTKLFITNAHLSHRNQFIWRINRALEEVKTKDKVDIYKTVWKLAKQYWKWRVQTIKPKQELSTHQDELTGFLSWLEHAPEEDGINELFPLIKRTLLKRNPLVSDHKFTEYLANNSEKHPIQSIQLYYFYYSQDHDNYRYYHDKKHIDSVMKNALAAGSNGKKCVRDFANRLGELGFFEYKHFWESSTK